jgi:Mrp family chromosome partitioning ATPase
MLKPSRLLHLTPQPDDDLPDPPEEGSSRGQLEGPFELESGRTNQRRIGAIMIDLGMLNVEQAERILEVQRASGERFGDIAVSLGYLRSPQLAVALARQRGTPTLLPEDLGKLSESLRAILDDPKSLRAYTDARTQLELRWFDDVAERRIMAIISDAPSEGRTLSTAVLGLLLAMTGRRVLLIDACVEAPRLAGHFGAKARESSMVNAMHKPEMMVHLPASLESLDLTVLSSVAGDLGSDAVSSRSFAALLGQAAHHWDAVLVDTPAWSVDRNALAVAVRCSGVMVIARMGHTRLSRLESMRRHLADAGIERIGAIAQHF